MEIVVVFPAPFPPSSAASDPSSISKVILSTATILPKCLDRFSTLIAAFTMFGIWIVAAFSASPITNVYLQNIFSFAAGRFIKTNLD